MHIAVLPLLTVITSADLGSSKQPHLEDLLLDQPCVNSVISRWLKLLTVLHWLAVR